MTLQEIKKQAYDLSVTERLELVEFLVQLIRKDLRPRPDRKGAAQRMLGLLKTDGPPPTDAEVEAMLEESLVEKYLK